jgi:hypothetical protein
MMMNLIIRKEDCMSHWLCVFLFVLDNMFAVDDRSNSKVQSQWDQIIFINKHVNRDDIL